MKKEPEYQVFGHKVYLPFGIPAGPLFNRKFVDAALGMNFDLPMHKTAQTRAKDCHPFPNVLAIEIDGGLTIEKTTHQLMTKHGYAEPLSITNSFGNSSQISLCSLLGPCGIRIWREK